MDERHDDHDPGQDLQARPLGHPAAKLWGGLVLALVIGVAAAWAVWGFRWPPTAAVVAEEDHVAEDLDEPVPIGR